MRQQTLDGAGRLEPGRIDADHLVVLGDARLEIRLGGEIIGARRGEARSRLRDVGAGDFADVETVPRLAQLFLQNGDVVLAQIENCGIAQHIHVRRGAVLENTLLRVAQGLAGAEHIAFGLPDAVIVAIAVENGLGHRQAERRRLGVVFELLVCRAGTGDGTGAGKCGAADFVEMAEAILRGGGDRRPIGGGGARNVFVLGAHPGALLIEIGIGLIGAGERARHRFRTGRRNPRKSAERAKRRQRAAKEHSLAAAHKTSADPNPTGGQTSKLPNTPKAWQGAAKRIFSASSATVGTPPATPPGRYPVHNPVVRQAPIRPGANSSKCRKNATDPRGFYPTVDCG